MLTSETMTATTARRRAAVTPTPIPALAADQPSAPPRLAWRRYRKLGWFCLKICLHLLWWDVILNRPILGWWRPPAPPRWRRIAGEFRSLAGAMGGVMVKLGQFLSLRADLLPRAVTEELALLQDRMEMVATSDIIAAVEADLGRPIHQLFAWFAPQPLASASIAQVHRAHLHSGEQVVVKVLRPGVRSQFEMDLQVIGRFVQMLQQLPRIRRTIDLAVVLAELVTATRRELDLASEGEHIERFAHDFAGDPQVYTPKVYWQYSGGATLTLEDVGYFKINQQQAIEATGINPVCVAEQLTKMYLQQIFVTHFLHADPHPGNIFVKPLPHPDEARSLAFAPGEPVALRPGRPFQIVLIDFGMVAEIPPSARTWLREFVIGLGTRDAHRIVQAYLSGGVLRPGADPARVEEMTAVLLASFQELLVGLMPEQGKAQPFFEDFADLAHDYPFQIPVDLLFMYRALGIVSGLVRQLDATFDLTEAAAPFAAQLMWEEWRTGCVDWLQAVASLGDLLLTPPVRPDQIWRQARAVLNPPPALLALLPRPEEKKTPEQASNERDLRTLRQLNQSVKRLSGMVAIVCLALAGLLWQSGGPPNKLGIILMGSALLFVLWQLVCMRGPSRFLRG